MTTELLDQRNLHNAWDIETPSSPVSEISDEMFKLRAKLYLEEFLELAEAMGKPHLLAFLLDDFASKAHKSNQRTYDKVEVLDALIDMHVIHCGTILVTGNHKIAEQAWVEVYKSNQSKLGEDGKAIRSDGTDGKPKGKILKGPNFKAPDLERLF